MKPKGVNRIVVAVNDLEAGMKLYGDLLGAQFIDVSADAEPFGLRCAISFDAGVEVCAPIPGRKSFAASHLKHHGEGIMSVVFCVDDVDEARRRAEKMGIATLAMIADYDQDYIDSHLEGRYKKYKEYMLDSGTASGFGMVIGQIEPK